MIFVAGFILALFGAIIIVACGLLGVPDYVKTEVARKASLMFVAGLVVCALSLSVGFVQWAWEVLP